MPDFTISKTGNRNWNAKWGSFVGGAQDKVSNGLKLVTRPVKVGNVGDVMLGRRIIALEGTIKIEFREVGAALKNGLIPWSTTAGYATPATNAAGLNLTPQVWHRDLYDIAQALTLHPTDKPVTDTSEDLTLLKAAPLDWKEETDGVKENILVVEFECYPDRSTMTTPPYIPNYGTYGV